MSATQICHIQFTNSDDSLAQYVSCPALSDEQRDECLTRLNEDGFSILPVRLPEDLLDRIVHYIDTYIDRVRNYEPNLASASEARYVYMSDSIVEDDPVWRELMMSKPALQVCHDVFGPHVPPVARYVEGLLSRTQYTQTTYY